LDFLSAIHVEQVVLVLRAESGGFDGAQARLGSFVLGDQGGGASLFEEFAQGGGGWESLLLLRLGKEGLD